MFQHRANAELLVQPFTELIILDQRQGPVAEIDMCHHDQSVHLFAEWFADQHPFCIDQSQPPLTKSRISLCKMLHPRKKQIAKPLLLAKQPIIFQSGQEIPPVEGKSALKPIKLMQAQRTRLDTEQRRDPALKKNAVNGAIRRRPEGKAVWPFMDQGCAFFGICPFSRQMTVDRQRLDLPGALSGHSLSAIISRRNVMPQCSSSSPNSLAAGPMTGRICTPLPIWNPSNTRILSISHLRPAPR